MSRLRVFEAFAGYGSQAMALRRLAVDYEVVGISEIDKYAIQAYNAVHGDTNNYGDICKIDWSSVPDFDLFTYSFPCQDISSAGRQRGFEEGSGTRSSLLWECRRAIIEKRPKYLLMENVKAITQKKFMPYLETWLDMLSFLGYSNFLKVLNAKDYGVPQNRERAFVVSILGEDEKYEFPKPLTLDKKLKDILEDEVDEKYFLSQRFIDTLERHKARMKERGNGFGFEPTHGEGVASSVLTTAGSRPDDNFVYANTRLQKMVDDNKITGEGVEFIDAYNQVVRKDYTSTIKTNINTENMMFVTGKPKSEFGVEDTLLIAQATKKGYVRMEPLNPDKNGLCRTIKAQYGKNSKSNFEREGSMAATGATDGYRIRKLTERECFRLMGVSDSDIDKIQAAGISRTQQYKLAGNSIVVNVLCRIFNELFKDTDYLIDVF